MYIIIFLQKNKNYSPNFNSITTATIALLSRKVSQLGNAYISPFNDHYTISYLLAYHSI